MERTLVEYCCDGVEFERVEREMSNEQMRRILNFLDKYEILCRQTGICFSHEDGQGGFLLENIDGNLIEWARAADPVFVREELFRDKRES